MKRAKFRLVWSPHPLQMYRAKNPSYLNSLVLGFWVPFLYLPTLIWSLVLAPVLTGILKVCAFILLAWINGLTCRLRALPPEHLDGSVPVEWEEVE